MVGVHGGMEPLQTARNHNCMHVGGGGHGFVPTSDGKRSTGLRCRVRGPVDRRRRNSRP